MKNKLLYLLFKLFIMASFWGWYPHELQYNAPTIFAAFSISVWILLDLIDPTPKPKA